MAQTQVIKINFRAGIVSTGALQQLLKMAADCGVKALRFGSRQQVLIDVPKTKATLFAAQCAGKNISVSTAGYSSENMVSSYAAAGTFITDGWLSQGVYKEVFDLFDYLPKLKININDGGQTFTPLFTGHINWIASSHVHFWYLYIRFPKTADLFRWPELIYTNHLAAVSKSIEIVVANEWVTDGGLLVQSVKNSLAYISKTIDQELPLPKFHLPYYEGFNAAGTAFWLGLYRRDECFSIAFLEELCAVCVQTKISEIYITSWKTLIIKGIEKGHRFLWDNVLGKHRINVRHAANELAWQVEDDCEDGLILKRHIIRYFDKEDVRTYGLCFTINLKSTSGLFGSVVIRKDLLKNPDRLKTLERFTILYTEDFNPNSSALLIFREGVKKEHLGPYLVSLCKEFYETIKVDDAIVKDSQQLPAVSALKPVYTTIYRCRHCFTAYDERLGEPEQNVAAGVGFNELPASFQCPLCEAAKEDFIVLEDVNLSVA